jgi:hypothetical protein
MKVTGISSTEAPDAILRVPSIRLGVKNSMACFKLRRRACVSGASEHHRQQLVLAANVDKSFLYRSTLVEICPILAPMRQDAKVRTGGCLFLQ